MTPCPACGAGPGATHRPGCNLELCPYCGCRLLTCAVLDKHTGGPWEDAVLPFGRDRALRRTRPAPRRRGSPRPPGATPMPPPDERRVPWAGADADPRAALDAGRVWDGAAREWVEQPAAGGL